ncbi:zinc finger protein 467-like [Nerophis ophidion]|uniref:zinc finger protein 467-like n=1 Tax=Nerophis ophidion TaxID=159077 RepID=UPI002AE08643|nr:zinc finger protein 467-like [Nerophis ophidion]
MLKELVKERLMASADEIFALFERTIASYEEELSRTKEENERHRQQLQAVCNTLQIKDVHQLIGRQKKCPAHLHGRNSSLNQEDPYPPNIEREDEVLWITQEGECLQGLKKVDCTDLPQTLVSVMIEDHEDKSPESSQFHYSPSEENGGAKPPSSCSPQHITEADGDPCGGSQAGNFLAPLSASEVDDMDATREPLSRDAGTHTHIQHSECSQNKTDVQQLIRPQEEHTPSPWGTLEPGPLPSHIKEEEEDIWATQGGECLRWLREANLTRLPLTGVSVKTEDHRQESQADNFLAPLSKCKDTASRFPDITQKLLSDTNGEGDLRTHTENKHSECSNKKTDKKHWTCTVCDKSFSNKGHLNRHMMTHTGEKPFCCPVCNKKFSQRSPMVSHMKTHSGKQYPCSVCGRSYYYKASLNAHTRTHHGELK